MKILVSVLALFSLAGCPATMPQSTQTGTAELKIRQLSNIAEKYPDQAQLATIGIIASGSDSPFIYNVVSQASDGRNNAQADKIMNEDGQCQIPPTPAEEFWPVSEKKD